MRNCLSRGTAVRRAPKRQIQAELSNQAAKHQFQFKNSFFQRLMLARGQQLQIAAQKKEIVQLARRSQRKMQKLSQLDSPRPATSFRNVGGNGIRSASHLTGQPIFFMIGESRRRPINAQYDGMAFLPNQQLSKVLHWFAAFSRTPPGITYYLILITYNSSRKLFQ